jgi:hypothetical protein
MPSVAVPVPTFKIRTPVSSVSRLIFERKIIIQFALTKMSHSGRPIFVHYEVRTEFQLIS